MESPRSRRPPCQPPKRPSYREKRERRMRMETEREREFKEERLGEEH
jgi:hypothetical protein